MAVIIDETGWLFAWVERGAGRMGERQSVFFFLVFGALKDRSLMLFLAYYTVVVVSVSLVFLRYVSVQSAVRKKSRRAIKEKQPWQ